MEEYEIRAFWEKPKRTITITDNINTNRNGVYELLDSTNSVLVIGKKINPIDLTNLNDKFGE